MMWVVALWWGTFAWSPAPTRPMPSATPTVAVVETAIPIEVPTARPTPVEPMAAQVLRTAPPGTRIVLTDLLPTAGGWAVLWEETAADQWDPKNAAEVWYAHIGDPAVPAMRLSLVHRIDRLPVYLAAPNPTSTEIAVVLNELTNWKTARRADPNRPTHQWFGRLGLDGRWLLEPSQKTVIETRLGVHGGIGHATWTVDSTRPRGLVRVTTEATCSNPAHQCTYSQRVDPATGKVLGRGSITISYLGHQTAPQIVPLSTQQSFLTTISDVMGSGGGIVARRDFLGGFPVTPIVSLSAFLLDLDPRSRWNGVDGAGRRIATLWRRVRVNDHRLNAAGEPWAMFLSQWDWVGTAPTLVRLGMTQLTDWSTKPGYSYGYPINSRWNTSLEHIDGGGWAVGFQLDGDYVVGALTETGEWLWRQSVGSCVDYAGDVSVRGDRIGYVTTRQGPGGVELVLGER